MLNLNNKTGFILIILVAILGVLSIYVFEKKTSSDFSSSLVAEFKLENTTRSDVESKIRSKDMYTEVLSLEDSSYRVFFNEKNINDKDTITTQINEVLPGTKDLDIRESTPIISTQIISRAIIILISFIIVISTFNFTFFIQIRRIDRLIISINDAIRTFILVFGLIGFTLFFNQIGLYIIRNEHFIIFAGSILMILVTKVIDVIYLNDKVAKELIPALEKNYTERVKNILNIGIMTVILFGGLLIPITELRSSITITITAILLEIGIIKFFDPISLQFFTQKLSSIKYFKKSKFWKI